MAQPEDQLIFAKSLALIEKTRKRIREIDSSDFPTPSSETARSLLLSALDEIATPALWASMSPEALFNTLIHIQQLVAKLESSSSDRIAWPLVSYCDRIWHVILKNQGISIFYAITTEHNFGIFSFSNRLHNTLSTVLTSAQIAKIVGNHQLYCLELASLEDENLPLYASIGHEFGHAIATVFKNRLRSILDLECRNVVKGIVATLNASEPLLASKRAQRTICVIWSLATELFCDLIGGLISGPAFVLSLHEMGWGASPGIWSATLVPKDDYIRGYPSSGFRLDCLKTIAGVDLSSARVRAISQQVAGDPLQKLADYVSTISTDHSGDRIKLRATPDSDIDRKAIEQALSQNFLELKNALLSFLRRCKTEFIPTLDAQSEFLPVQDEHVAKLLERLAKNIIPNIVPDGTLLGLPANFATILNAAALYRINLMLSEVGKNGVEHTYELFQKVERLTAKAFEVSYIQREFNSWKARSKP